MAKVTSWFCQRFGHKGILFGTTVAGVFKFECYRCTAIGLLDPKYDGSKIIWMEADK